MGVPPRSISPPARTKVRGRLRKRADRACAFNAQHLSYKGSSHTVFALDEEGGVDTAGREADHGSPCRRSALVVGDQDECRAWKTRRAQRVGLDVEFGQSKRRKRHEFLSLERLEGSARRFGFT